MAANDNARVLDSGGTEVAGIRFYGVADPTFTPGKGHQVEEFEDLKVDRSVGVADAVDRQALRPDVLLVHDGRLAAYARGHVATVLDGHLHRFGTEVVNGTRTLQTGTVGAGGPDNFRAEDPPPADAQVIYFDPETRRPVAVDRITVSLPGSSFSVERLLLPEGATPFAPDPLEVPPELAPGPRRPGRLSPSPHRSSGVKWRTQQFFRSAAISDLLIPIFPGQMASLCGCICIDGGYLVE